MKISEKLAVTEASLEASQDRVVTQEAPQPSGEHDYYHSPAMYGLVRLPAKWRVILSRRGQRFLKDFAFSRYGGETAALACAQAYRDEVVRSHLPPERRELAQKLRMSNRSGVAGVTYRFNTKGEIASWHAITRVSADCLLTKCFSVSRYGAAQAELLAIAERQKQLEQMSGLRQVHPAEESVRDRVGKKADASKASASRSRPKLPEPIPVAEILRRSNSSGTPGVSCVKGADGLPRYWLAKTGGVEGKSMSQSFSVKTHGNAKARLLAIEARRAQLERKMQIERPEALAVDARPVRSR